MKWVIPAAIVAVAAVALLMVAGSSDRPLVQRSVIGSPTVDPGAVPDPSTSGDLPDGYRHVLPRDAILPVYHPTFTAADDARWQDNALVIGVEIDGEAKAYPVSFLNRREMVVDRLSGVPILVTW